MNGLKPHRVPRDSHREAARLVGLFGARGRQSSASIEPANICNRPKDFTGSLAILIKALRAFSFTAELSQARI